MMVVPVSRQIRRSSSLSLSRVISSSAPKGLVHEQHPGPADEGPGDGHPLPHPAGELVGKSRLPARETDEGEKLVGLRVLLHVSVPPADLERQTHVVDCAPPGKQGGVLEHEGEIAREPRLLRGAAEDTDRPVADRDQIGNGPEQGRLAAPGWAEHGDEPAGGHVEAHPVERGDVARIALEPHREVTHRHRCRACTGGRRRRERCHSRIHPKRFPGPRGRRRLPSSSRPPSSNLTRSACAGLRSPRGRRSSSRRRSPARPL